MRGGFALTYRHLLPPRLRPWAHTTVVDRYEWLFAFEAVVHFHSLRCKRAEERLAPLHVLTLRLIGFSPSSLSQTRKRPRSPGSPAGASSHRLVHLSRRHYMAN